MTEICYLEDTNIFKETKRKSGIEIQQEVTAGKQLKETKVAGTSLKFQQLQSKFGESEMRILDTESRKAKLDK